MPGTFGALVAGGTSIANGVLGAQGQAGAVSAAQSATNANNTLANQVYSTNTNNLQPFDTAGQASTNELEGLLGIGGNQAQANQAFQTYLNSTPYQFNFTQGTDAVNTANAASFNSGANEKALDQYGQGVAGEALQGYESALSGVSSQGITAGSQLANTGTQYVSQESSNNNNLAGVEGAASINTANAEENALNGVAGSATSAYYANPSAFSGIGGGSAPSSVYSGAAGIGSTPAPITSNSAFSGIPVPSSDASGLGSAASSALGAF